jgi:4-hydroxy-tetrahydrodipicolinate synthase
MRFRSDPVKHIRGSIAPVVTPFTDDGELDLESLTGLIRWQLENGSHGISLGGSTGEPSAQTTAERKRAMDAAAATIADKVPFLPGTGSAKLDETLELTAYARQAGADAALVITPYYARPTQEGLYRWYATVASENQDLPIFIYNVPSRTAVDIAPETVARLRGDHANIVGVKETTKDFEHFSRVLHAAGRDTIVLSGIELLCLPLLALGGNGFVSATANIAPAATARMYDHWVSGEHEQARDLHYALHPLVDLTFTETNPAPIKWVLWQAGLIRSAHVRPPLAPLSEPGAARVGQLLKQAGHTGQADHTVHAGHTGSEPAGTAARHPQASEREGTP